MNMKLLKAVLVCGVLGSAVSACTWQQLGQGAYDSAKSSECMERTGRFECDLSE